jgi:septal ring-binding cell division protein DamX
MRGPVSRRGKADVAPTTFSLQLGAFSSAPAAQALIARHGLGGAARVHEHGGAGSVMYLVLLGNYATRREAEAAAMQPQLDGLEPWIRPVEGL